MWTMAMWVSIKELKVIILPDEILTDKENKRFDPGNRSDVFLEM